MNNIQPDTIIAYLKAIGWEQKTNLNFKNDILNDIKEEFGEINNKVLNKVLKHFF